MVGGFVAFCCGLNGSWAQEGIRYEELYRPCARFAYIFYPCDNGFKRRGSFLTCMKRLVKERLSSDLRFVRASCWAILGPEPKFPEDFRCIARSGSGTGTLMRNPTWHPNQRSILSCQLKRILMTPFFVEFKVEFTSGKNILVSFKYRWLQTFVLEHFQEF